MDAECGDDAVVTLDHIAKEEPNVSPVLYAGRKEKAETIINGFEELERYREIGTVGECRAAVERNQTKQVTDIQGDKLKFGTCPCCGRRISDIEGGNYCQNCGQRLEWRE